MARPLLLFPVVSAVLSFGLTAPARAQLVATATLESEYRLRGVSLTDGKPDARFGLSYDHDSGVYGGVSAVVGEIAGGDVKPLGYIGYLGFAKRTPNGLTWDFGVTTSHITLNIPAQLTSYSSAGVPSTIKYIQRYPVDYSEVYAGIAKRDLSMRLYLSPDYLGQGLRTAYLDVTGAVRPTSRLRLYAHAGALTPLGGRPGPNSGREYYDVRTGAAWEFHHGEIQLAWTATTPQVRYPVGYRQTRSALILSATGYF